MTTQSFVSLLRIQSVNSSTGKSKSTIYREIGLGMFPPPVDIGGGRSAWPDNEVAAINRARIAGKSEAEIKALVSELIAARSLLA